MPPWALAVAFVLLAGVVVVLAHRLSRQRRALRRLHGAVHTLARQVSPPAHGEAEALLEEVARQWAALVREREGLRSALNALRDGVLLLDGEGRLLFGNPAAWDLVGAPAPEEGQRPTALLGDHQVREVVERARARGVPQRGEGDLPRSRRRVEVSAIPIPGGMMLLVVRDLTPVYRLQTTRREFVANISHQLRTPLAAMRAALETLEEGALEDPGVARTFLAGLKREVELMERLVRELLDLSRLESGQVSLRLAPLPVEVVVREVVERFHPLAQQAGLTLTTSLSPGLPPVLADRDKVVQALSNLLENAIRFTPAGGKIEVRASAQGDQVAFAVEDTGIGIPPEHLPHIFERFYKAHHIPGDTGAGLGLAIVKHIAQAHGGSVRVESQEGRGSTFTLLLPAAYRGAEVALEGPPRAP
jgi:two-component system phosphate regulon sensor histidine kinase PhoR